MYVYIQSEPGLWTVGFYDPTGKWCSESDHESIRSAARKVSFLNGGAIYDPDARFRGRVVGHVCPNCGMVTNAR